MIPVFDISTANENKAEFLTRLLAACKDTGFLYLQNHTIPQQDVDRMFELVISAPLFAKIKFWF